MAIAVTAYILVVLGLNALKYRARNTYFKEVIHELKAQSPAYYYSLPDHLKTAFERKVFEFIRQKEFVPRGNLTEISTAMKVKIAVCATQLTFGLKPVYLSHFKSILTYPDRYYSTISKHYHCGEVNMRGCIVLSWKDFELAHPQLYQALSRLLNQDPNRGFHQQSA